MRNIAEVVIFTTPFEEKATLETKFTRMQQMIEDYFTNSQIPINKTIRDNEEYRSIEYNTLLWIQIVYSKKIGNNPYFPFIIGNYFIDEANFHKEDIEYFLNDHIKFIHNVFFEDFFIDYDEKYTLIEINKGKTLRYEELEQFDLTNKWSKKNKKILDSLMFLYYTLIKKMYEIENFSQESSKHKEYFLQGYSAFLDKKHSLLKEQMQEMAKKIKYHIDTFLSFFSN